MKFVFEAMGGTYRQCGDFFIPEIALPDTPGNPIGKYGRMRHRYLKEHHIHGVQIGIRLAQEIME